MLKILAIGAMALVLIGFRSNSETHKAQQAQNSQQPVSTVANSPIEQKDSTALKEKANQHIDADVRVKEMPQKDGYDRAAFWISVVLAGVGLIGVGVGIGTLLFLKNQTSHIKRQADEMERQRKDSATTAAEATKIAKEAAEAALLNAKALLHSQRPWVIVQTEEMRGENAAKTHFRLTGYNHGGSPAFVTSCHGPKIAWLADPDRELPVVPEYGEFDWDARFILPRHKFFLGDEINPWSERRVTPVGLQLVVYGLIEYRDGITDEVHRTAYCYRRKRDKLSDMGGHLVPCGPAAYNQCT